MKKAIFVIIFGLLWCNSSLATEVILRCIFEGTGQRITIEVDLKKKIAHVDDYLYDLETIGDRAIIAKRKNGIARFKLDRFDGFIELKDSNEKEFEGYCKKYNKLF